MRRILTSFLLILSVLTLLVFISGCDKLKLGKPSYIIAIDNSIRSEKYIDQAKSRVEEILKEIPDSADITLVTLNSGGAAIKGKADISAFISGIKPASIATDFRMLFDEIRKNINEKGKNRVFVISNGKFDPKGSIYLEGLENNEAEAQSLVLAEQIKDAVKMPANCEIITLSIGDRPDEIILQAIAGNVTDQEPKK